MLKKVIIGMLIVVALLLTIVIANSSQKQDVEVKKEESDILDDYEKIEDDVLNILLIGVDGDNEDKGNRSDSMMILTLDIKNQGIRLTSIGRDTYAHIEGYGSQKLNHAYAYGGPELLLDTINKNFGTDIEKYIAVSFKSFMEIIDEIGGVEVNVEAKDIDMINSVISSTYTTYSKDKSDVTPIQLIENDGVQLLNGYQALAFSRIRYTDDGYARDSRQREIILSVYNSVMHQSLSELNNLVSFILNNSRTNISTLEIVDIGMNVYGKEFDMDELQFPVESHRKDVLKEGAGWVTEWDEEYNKKVLENFIYNYEDYLKEK